MTETLNVGESESGGQSRVSRVFGVGFRRETYANLAYLLARFPIGIAYFTTFVTGLSVGLALVPLIVGIPIISGVLGLAGYVGVVEASLLRRIRGVEVSHHPADPSELSMVAYLKTVATDPRNYLFVLFAFVSFAVGITLFVVITVVFTLALTLVAAPALYWLPGVDYDVTGVEGTLELGALSFESESFVGASIDTFPEALLASLLGVVICLVGLHAVNLTARLHGDVSERLVKAT